MEDAELYKFCVIVIVISPFMDVVIFIVYVL